MKRKTYEHKMENLLRLLDIRSIKNGYRVSIGQNRRSLYKFSKDVPKYYVSYQAAWDAMADYRRACGIN